MNTRTLALLSAAMALPAMAAESALDIVRRSLDLQDRNFQRARNYTYQQRQVATETDEAGRPKSTKSRTYDVLRLYGRPYRRLIEKDGKPLAEGENRKEEEKVHKELEKRRRQAEDPDSKERRAYEKEEAELQRVIREIQEAFTFRLVGEENVSGQPAWVIQAEPKPDYRPRESRAAVYKKMRAKFWIDKAEYQWVKVDAETLDTISFGFFIARLSRGSSLHFEQRRVNDEVWLPSRAQINIDARLALVKKLRTGVAFSYSNYRKFQSESKVVSTEAVP